MDSFGYDLTSDKKAIIKKYLGSISHAVIVPAKLFGNDVVAIGDNAFHNEIKFTGAVELTHGIKIIGSYAFAKCENIEKIVLPSSIEEIKDGAFSDCDSLEEVVFLGNMPKIGKDLFKQTMFVKVRYYATSRGWESSTFAGREAEPISETETYIDQSDDDEMLPRGNRYRDEDLQEGDVYGEGELLHDEQEEDLFQYEEPRYMAEVNVFERVGVGSVATTSIKNLANPIEAFRLRLSGIFNKVKQSSKLSESDLVVMLEPISIIENIKFKSPAGYLLGYIASERGYQSSEKGFKLALDLLPFINDGKSDIITPPDIIRYMVFWISVRKNYLN